MIRLKTESQGWMNWLLHSLTDEDYEEVKTVHNLEKPPEVGENLFHFGTDRFEV